MSQKIYLTKESVYMFQNVNDTHGRRFLIGRRFY